MSKPNYKKREVFPLAAWRLEEGLWVSEDSDIMFVGFFLERFFGFDLPEFDVWLASLVSKSEIDGLTTERAAAIYTAMNGRQDEAILRLNHLLLHKKRIQELSKFGPFALKGIKAAKQMELNRIKALEVLEERKDVYSKNQIEDWRRRLKEMVKIKTMSKRNAATRIAEADKLPKAFETIRKLKI